MKIHTLKILPQHYQPVADGAKPFEVRFNDRGYQKGDYLLLREWDQEQKEYTGREIIRFVSCILADRDYLADHMVILGLRDLDYEMRVMVLKKVREESLRDSEL